MGSETWWAHLSILGGVLVPVVLAWWDNRNRQRKHWDMALKQARIQWETHEAQDQERHLENVVRLARIETALTPITTWFNNGRSSGSREGVK